MFRVRNIERLPWRIKIERILLRVYVFPISLHYTVYVYIIYVCYVYEYRCTRSMYTGSVPFSLGYLAGFS